jgi:tetratricopeptide (TPR) repeat protein
MKKINLILLMLLLVSVTTFAQKGKVNSAQFALTEGKIQEAKKNIDEALTDAETQQTVKAWQLKGDIYKSIYEGKIFFTQTPTALEDAKAAYLKAYELETNPKKKNAVAPSLEQIGSYFFTEGLSRFESEKWAEAYLKFNEAVVLNDFLTKNNLTKTIDTSAIYATSLAAHNGGLKKESIDLLERLVALKYKNKVVYETLVDLYQQDNNPKFLSTLDEGLKMFPDSKSLQVSKLNYYIQNNKTDEAVAEINNALKTDPNNPTLLFNMAVLNEQLQKYHEAIKYYDKAIENNPKYTDAMFNAGAMYFNKAVEINKVINDDTPARLDSTIAEFVATDIVTLDEIKAALKEQNLSALINSFNNYANDKNALKEKVSKVNENLKYELIQAKRNALFNKAMPYFEKAYSMDKNLVQIKSALKEIYARMNMFEKIKTLD